MSNASAPATPLPGQRQEVCPYLIDDKTSRTPPTTMSRRGDYLHGRWFWQEKHVQFITPDTLYELADTQEPDTTSPDQALNHAELHDWLCELVRTLPRRDQKVMQLRYGLLDGRARSLRETGRSIGVSPERVRQIEARIIYRLKRRLGVLPRRPLPSEFGPEVAPPPLSPPGPHGGQSHERN